MPFLIIDSTLLFAPQDVYTQVADLVRESCRSDPDKNQVLASLLADTVDRKLVKQTVMTSVYGVTFAGARDQIQKRLKERNFQKQRSYDSFDVAAFAARVRAAS